jgi:hypothetical protein
MDDQNSQNIIDLSYNGIQILLGIASEIEAEQASVKPGANHFHVMQPSGFTCKEERKIVKEDEQWPKAEEKNAQGPLPHPSPCIETRASMAYT